MVFEPPNFSFFKSKNVYTSDLQVLVPQSSRYEGGFRDPLFDKELRRSKTPTLEVRSIKSEEYRKRRKGTQ